MKKEDEPGALREERRVGPADGGSTSAANIAGGRRAAVALGTEGVWRGGQADPQADLERPRSEALRVLLALELESADQRRGAAELIEGQQPQRVPRVNEPARAFGRRTRR